MGGGGGEGPRGLNLKTDAVKKKTFFGKTWGMYAPPLFNTINCNLLSQPNSGATPVSSNVEVEGHNNLAFEIEVGEEAKEHGGGEGSGEDISHSPRDSGRMEGITNPAFEDDHSGEENEAEPRSDGMLEDGVIPSNNNSESWTILIFIFKLAAFVILLIATKACNILQSNRIVFKVIQANMKVGGGGL